MSEEFKRQIRYIVLKNNDVSRALDADQHRELLALCAVVSEHREAEGKLPMQAVVVESDWSIYEQVWKLVELEAQGIKPDDRLAQPEPPVQSHEEWVKEGGRLATIAADAGYQCGKDMSTETSAAMMSAMSDLLTHLRNHPAAVPEDPPIEEVEEIIACLGDDAALLRDKNPDCEIAANMEQAVALIRILLAIPAADFEMSTQEQHDAAISARKPAKDGV